MRPKQRGRAGLSSTLVSSRPFADGTTSLAIGLISAALLSSLAAAGLSTLAVARVLLFAAWVIGLVFLARSQVSAGRLVRERVLAAVILTVLLVAVERLESRSQPKPSVAPHLPFPPLKLLVHPLFTRLTGADFTPLKSLPLELGPVSRPMGGYPAFDLDNDKDQVMFGIGDVVLYNMASKPLLIDATLDVDGPGVHLQLAGNGRGAGVRQLNENDWTALQDPPSTWLLSPIEVPPRGFADGDLAFVVPAEASERLRKMIVYDKLQEGYRYQLTLRNRASGAYESITLPFGPRTRQNSAKP